MLNLAAEFAPIAKAMTENEAQIVKELKSVKVKLLIWVDTTYQMMN